MDSFNRDDFGRYDFSNKERGVALLIHNEFFSHYSNYKDRPGDNLDYKHMKKLFKMLGFKVISFRDKTKREMLKIATEVASWEEHKESDCFVCVIASHGEEAQTDTDVHSTEHTREHVIIGVDGNDMKTSDFVEKFDDDHCEGLQGKPKFFFIQACRISRYGDKLEGMDKGIKVLMKNKEKKKKKTKSEAQSVDGLDTCENDEHDQVNLQDPKKEFSDNNNKTDSESGSESIEDKHEDDDDLTSDTDDDENFWDFKAKFEGVNEKSVHDKSLAEQTKHRKSRKKRVDELDAKGYMAEDESIKVPMVTIVPCPEDTLIMFASLSGNFAVRGHSSGGWLLNKLYQCLRLYAKNPEELEVINFLDILTEVLTCMYREIYKPKGKDPLGDQFSPGCLTHCLTNSVYFTKKPSKRKKFFMSCI